MRPVLLTTLLFLCAISHTIAQTASPYSRYGLGVQRSTAFSANRGFGEIAAGWTSNFNINHTNPASYADIALTTFETGALLETGRVSTRDSSYRLLNGNVSHVVLGMPVKRDLCGISFGLLPYSYTNYNFLQKFNSPDVGEYNKLQRGNGSLYQIYFGTGFKIKEFRIGFNAGYLFGKQEFSKVITFPDSVNALNTRNNNEININGFLYSVGVQYRWRILHKTAENKLKHDYFFTLGAYGTSGNPVSAKYSNYWERFGLNSSGTAILIDSVQVSNRQTASLSMPWYAGIGFTVGTELHWLLGADFRYDAWSRFNSPFANDRLADKWRVSLGAQFVPNVESRKIFARMQLRFGGYYGMSEFYNGTTRLQEAGGTVGIGLPVKKSVARFNLSADMGMRGINAGLALRETYYRITLALVLNDRWFIKRKFD
jgi:hypothetical protein